jgi:hypothetical protein
VVDEISSFVGPIEYLKQKIQIKHITIIAIMFVDMACSAENFMIIYPKKKIIGR